MKIVMIEWVDSRFLPGDWQCREHSTEATCAFPISIGVVVKETDKEITLIPHLDGGHCAQGIVISKACIKRIRQLKVKEEK